MKNTFPGYYRPSEEEFSELWDNCLFVLDANVLLNLYRYTPDTRNELLQILESIKDRLWVPYQAAFEYQKNRLKVISTQREAYDQIDKAIQKTQNQLENELRTYLRHPYLDVPQLLDEVDIFFSTIRQDLQQQKEEHPDLLTDDALREKITTLLEGKVGPPYPPEELEKICEEGKQRYEQEIPPGYEDADDKNDERQFGDLVVWYQTIDKATDTKKPIILVTDDRKDDWWWTFKGRTIGPRPELVSEIRSEAGVSFYIYRSDQFMEYAQEYLQQQVDQQAIDEVRSLREMDAELRYLYTDLIERLEVALTKQVLLRNRIMSIRRKISQYRQELDTLELKLKVEGIDSQTPTDPEVTEKQIVELRMTLEKLITEEHDLQVQHERLVDRVMALRDEERQIENRLERTSSESKQ
jgi:hypothetical protein